MNHVKQPTARRTEKLIQKEVHKGQLVDTSKTQDALNAKAAFNPNKRAPKKKQQKVATPAPKAAAPKKRAPKHHKKSKRATPAEKIPATASPANVHKEGVRWINVLSRQLREAVRSFKMKMNKAQAPKKAKRR